MANRDIPKSFFIGLVYPVIALISIGINCYAASQRKVIGKELAPTDVSAINQNFQNINNELLNVAHRTSTETVRGFKTFSEVIKGTSTFANNASTATNVSGGTGDLSSLTVSGPLTVSPYGVTAISVSTTGAVQMRGSPDGTTVSNDKYGAYVSTFTDNWRALTNNTWVDLCSITFSTGVWMVSATFENWENNATTTNETVGCISSTAGNDGTGCIAFDTQVEFTLPTKKGVSTISATVSERRWVFTSNTTLYLKMLANFSAGTQNGGGNIRGWRMQ